MDAQPPPVTDGSTPVAGIAELIEKPKEQTEIREMEPKKEEEKEQISWITAEPKQVEQNAEEEKEPTDEGEQREKEEVPAEEGRHKEGTRISWMEEKGNKGKDRLEEERIEGDSEESGFKEANKVVAEEKPKARADACKDENGFTYYKCRFCGLTFNFMTTLKAHERVHDVQQPYLCNKCGESFHYMCELEYHAKTHLQQKGYKCECGRTFFQYTDLLYHHHPGEDEPLAAQPLPSSSSAAALIPSASASAIHPAEFPVPEFAERGFEPKHPLRVYSDVRSKPYICQYCSKSYADSRGLAYHMYSHRGERIFNPRASRYLMCRNENSYLSPGIDLKDA